MPPAAGDHCHRHDDAHTTLATRLVAVTVVVVVVVAAVVLPGCLALRSVPGRQSQHALCASG